MVIMYKNGGPIDILVKGLEGDLQYHRYVCTGANSTYEYHLRHLEREDVCRTLTVYDGNPGSPKAPAISVSVTADGNLRETHLWFFVQWERSHCRILKPGDK